VKLLIFIGLNLFGALGWWIGEPSGIWPAFIISGIGSILGVYLGWWTAQRLLP